MTIIQKSLMLGMNSFKGDIRLNMVINLNKHGFRLKVQIDKNIESTNEKGNATKMDSIKLGELIVNRNFKEI
jgi:hypothetical protein